MKKTIAKTNLKLLKPTKYLGLLVLVSLLSCQATGNPTTPVKPGATSNPTTPAKPGATSNPATSAKPGATSNPTTSAKPGDTSNPVSLPQPTPFPSSPASPASSTSPVSSASPATTKDTTPPNVSFTSPVNAEIGIAVNSKIVTTFSEVMDPATVNTGTFTVTGPGGAAVGIVTYVATTATFTPTGNLLANTTYTAMISAGVKDLAGNALAANTSWTFTTGTGADTTPPTVTATKPLNLASSVIVNGQVLTTFSEPMDPVTLSPASYMITAPGPTPIAGTVSYAGNVATFTPTVDLPRNTTFTGTITTAAKDLAGNALAVTKTWTFTSALGPAPVNMLTAKDFVILGQSGISCVPICAITGDMGVSPIDLTAITGFSTIMDASTTFATSAQVTGRIYAADLTLPTPTKMTTAISDMITAYADAAGRSLPDFINLGAGEIGGETLVPGLYKWGTGVAISNDVTLSGGPNDVWIFEISGNIAQAAGKKVILTGGALPKNIFWQLTGALNMDAGSHMEGIVLAKTAINVGNGASIDGRLLAQTAIALDANRVTQPAP